MQNVEEKLHCQRPLEWKQMNLIHQVRYIHIKLSKPFGCFEFHTMFMYIGIYINDTLSKGSC